MDKWDGNYTTCSGQPNCVDPDPSEAIKYIKSHGTSCHVNSGKP